MADDEEVQTGKSWADLLHVPDTATIEPRKTLLDEFAMVAIGGLVATKAPIIAAQLAYEVANAMMAERSKREG